MTVNAKLYYYSTVYMKSINRKEIRNEKRPCRPEQTHSFTGVLVHSSMWLHVPKLSHNVLVCFRIFKGAMSQNSRNARYSSLRLALWLKWKYTSISSSSTSIISCLTAHTQQRFVKWQMHPMSRNSGWTFLIRNSTELCRPFITLQLSDENAMRFVQGIPRVLKDN